MIRLESIEIEEFRGIKKLQIDLRRKNFGICGPNGTGKSGVVDSIEFALTGNITRLSGSGSKELSVKAHAPHVDVQKHPEKSVVKLNAFCAKGGKPVTIQRQVSAVSTPVVMPDTAEVRNIIAGLSLHPEFALSRREIVKYILTPAGKRADDVQTLLRLDQIEKIRKSLQKIANDAKKDLETKTDEDERAKKNLLQHLQITSLSKSALLQVVNTHRATLKMEPLVDLVAGQTTFKGDLTAEKQPAKPTSKVSKAGGTTQVSDFRELFNFTASEEAANLRAEALSQLESLKSDAHLLQSFRQKSLVLQGIQLLEEDECPLCNNPRDMNELLAHFENKLTKAEAATELVSKLEKVLRPLARNFGAVARSAAALKTLCDSASPKIESASFDVLEKECVQNQSIFDKVSEEPSLIDEAIQALSTPSLTLPSPVQETIGKLANFFESLPEPSKEEAARDFLTIAQERYDRCTETKKAREAALARSTTASKVSEAYAKVSTEELEKIYDEVEKDFTTYYRIINRDDEEGFEGELTPSFGKLAFDVDFYGRGKYPPGAYHSEGHQDGMGLCLYLALMKHTLGADFTFAVLDDVLMSVDVGHRREVCTLLKTQFPQTQFIITTHDPMWLQFMRTENLIQSSISFAGWTVDGGPLVWKDADVWEQIDEKLTKNDVPGAAHTLRRYLEYMCAILADNLRASVEYHGNGSYDFGDLLPAVIRAWKDLLANARDAAASWGQDTSSIDALKTEVKEKISEARAEQWVINKSVHFNPWANLQAEEFRRVATAFRELLSSMQCTNAACREFAAVTPKKGKMEAIRCSCGNVNLNLKKK